MRGAAVAEEPQPIRALRRAREVRRASSAAKKELLAGDLLIRDAFGDPRLQTVRVGEILRAQRRWGKARVERLLGRVSSQAGILSQKRLSEIPEVQRRRILECIENPDLDFPNLRRGF